MLLYLTPDERECLYLHADVRTLSALARTCKKVGDEVRPLLQEQRAAFLLEHLCILKPSFRWTREGLECVGVTRFKLTPILARGTMEERQESRFVCVVPTLDLEDVYTWHLPLGDRYDSDPVFPDLQVVEVAQSVYGGDFLAVDGTHFKQIVPIVVTLRSTDGVTVRLEGYVQLGSYYRHMGWDLRIAWALREDGASRVSFEFLSHVIWEGAVVS